MTLDELMTAAQERWLDGFVEGPTEPLGPAAAPGTEAPDLTLADHTGAEVSLSSFWSDGPALLMFWRHFGCGCGIDRAARLGDELADYESAGLTSVIIGQGEPERAAQYRDRHGVAVPVLSDPEFAAYRAYGVGHFAPEQLYYEDGDAESLELTREAGLEAQAGRPAMRELVDDPWRASAEFVVGANGVIRLAYAYQWCEDFPHPGILTAAARFSE